MYRLFAPHKICQFIIRETAINNYPGYHIFANTPLPAHFEVLWKNQKSLCKAVVIVLVKINYSVRSILNRIQVCFLNIIMH